MRKLLLLDPRILAVIALALTLGADRAQAHGLAVWAEVLEDGRTVRIEAFYSDGRAVPGARVEVDRPADSKTADGAAAEAEQAMERVAEGKTDADGRFELRVDAPTRLIIRVRAGGHHHGKAELEKKDFAEAAEAPSDEPTEEPQTSGSTLPL